MYHSAALSHFRQYLERLLALAEVPEDELNPLTDNWLFRCVYHICSFSYGMLELMS